MKITCPECGVSGTLDEAHAGRKIRCPKCAKLFVAGGEQPREILVPEPSQPAAQPAGAASDAACEPGEPESKIEQEIPATPPPPPHEEEGEAEAKPHSMAGGTAGTAGEGRSWRLGDLLSRAWELTVGVKGQIWGGLAVYGVMTGIFTIIFFFLATLGFESQGVVVRLLDLVNSALSAVLSAGMAFMGVKRATGREVIWKDVFSGFALAGQLIVAMLLQSILIILGLLLLILPGIYLAIGYGMTFGLMLDKGMGPWQAMETSRKAIHRVWWKVFGLYLLVTLIVMLSAIPLGIGLIWTLPLSIVLYGVLYATLFEAR